MENPDVRQAIYEMMNWWLERGIDGFRMDVINFIWKVLGLPDGKDSPFGASRYYMNGPGIHEFLQEMHREVLEGRLKPLLNDG